MKGPQLPLPSPEGCWVGEGCVLPLGGHPYQGQQHHRAPSQAVRDGPCERCREELQD